MVYLSISYIQFININGTAWGHGQVIEMCSRVIFSISVALKGNHVSPKITCSYMYMYVVGCYAAWNNNYSGQEEATLCIVKSLKEDRKLVFQMKNKLIYSNV